MTVGLGRRPRIAVIDYGAGNLVSIDQALWRVGADARLVASAAALADVEPDAVIVPGVGAAAAAMVRLERQGLVDPMRSWLAADRPFLGICLGLQLLFEGSDEDGAATLGALPGRTTRLNGAPTLPHIGWNQVVRTRPHPIFDGIEDGADFYFVHSYAGEPAHSVQSGATGLDADAVLARTEHGRPFVSAVARGSMLGVQFHPERSGTEGLRLLANFVDLVRAA